MYKNSIQEYYNSASEQYLPNRPWLHFYVHPRIRRIVLPCLKNLDRKDMVLHVGCGPGWLEKAIHSTNVSTYIALDFSSKMAQLTKRENPWVESIVADCEALPFRSQSFKVIIINRVIKYVSASKIFKQIKLLLTDEGLVAVVFDSGEALWKRIAERAGIRFWGLRNKNWRSSEIRGSLSDQDFKVIRRIPITRLGDFWFFSRLWRLCPTFFEFLDLFLKNGSITVIFGERSDILSNYA
jgi:hypothetical protein